MDVEHSCFWRDAKAVQVVWARVKGYPFWPAQVLTNAAAKQLLAGVQHKCRDDAPVIFFGMSEIAWMARRDVTDWQQGMQQSFHLKGRKNKKFVLAMEQVAAFLSLTSERVAPPGWWCPPPAPGAPPPPPEPPASSTEEAAADVQQQPRQLGSATHRGTSAAAEAAELQQAAAVAAAVINRSLQRHGSGPLQEHAPHKPQLQQQLSGGGRTASGTIRSACQQIWGSGGGGSRHASLDGAAAEQIGGLGRQQRKRRAPRAAYSTEQATDSEDSEQQLGSDRGGWAASGRAAHGSRRAAVGGALADSSAAPSYVQAKRQRLLLDPQGGSESEATDTESLAMAAVAMAQLASGEWDHEQLQQAQPRQQQSWQQQPQRGRTAAAAAQPHPRTPKSTQQQQRADAGALRVQLHVQGDAVGLCVQVLQEPHVVVDHPPGVYTHGGCGLPCSLSWQYAVAMPGAAAPAGQLAGAASGDQVACQPLQAAAAGAKQQEALAAKQQQQQPVHAQQLAVPLVAACPATAYHRQLFTQFAAAPGAAAAAAEGGDNGNSGAADLAASQPEASSDAAGPPADAVASPRGGGSGMLELLAPQQGSVCGAAPEGPPGAQRMAIAASAAINAAFSASSIGSQQQHWQHQQQWLQHQQWQQQQQQWQLLQQQQQQQQQPYHSSSAACSERSGGASGAARAAGGSSSASGRRRTSAASAYAAAAALAAAHTLTPPNPAADAEVASLLLSGAGPLLPAAQGLPDAGFVLPRQLLLNRPPKFEPLKRNLFVSRERPKRLGKEEVQVCCCRPERVRYPDGSEAVVGCRENCLNRLSFIHCDPRTCPCGPLCSNKPFHALKAPQLEVFLTADRGHGVRVGQPLAKGEFVVEYAGEVIDQAELARRMDAARDSGEHHFYIMELGPGLFIDARRKGNHARLLNSCCDPNCETQKWRDAATGEGRIGIFTTRPVGEREELMYDYMFEHSGVGALARGFKCMCGAKNCRGTMDANPDRKRDWGRRLEVFWEGDGVYYRGTVTGFSTTSGKHTVMYDDGDVERVKLGEVPHRWLDGDASPHTSAQAAGGQQAQAPKVNGAADSSSCSEPQQQRGRLGDRVVAADALVTLGLAAAAELEHMAQPAAGALAAPPQLPQQQHYGRVMVHPAVKRRRISSEQQQGSAWGGVLQAPQPQRQQVAGQFLPLEQLLSGIQAIKRQGPPLFQQQQHQHRQEAAAGGDRPQQAQQKAPHKQLLDLVGVVRLEGGAGNGGAGTSSVHSHSLHSSSSHFSMPLFRATSSVSGSALHKLQPQESLPAPNSAPPPAQQQPRQAKDGLPGDSGLASASVGSSSQLAHTQRAQLS